MTFSRPVRGGQNSAIWAVLFCFFASGLSGLVYQVVWVRELVLVFGATTFAVSTVLTAFMGGLALGSYYFGRRVKQITRPLRLYGLLEIGIGAYGLAVPLIFAFLPSIYHPIWQRLQLSFLAISVVRFAFAGLVLIVPTALMGATLPVLSTYYARDRSRIGLHVGTLYSINTFGAVIGAAATGFALIPILGMRVTTATAAGLNILLGLVALSVSRSHELRGPLTEDSSLANEQAPTGDALKKPERVPERGPGGGLLARFWGRKSKGKKGRRGRSITSEAETLNPSRIPIVLVCFALSGFIALSYEVIWSRVLALIIGSSVYAFSIMLTTFLIGLALGASTAARFVDRIRRPVLAFALIELGVGAASLVGAYLFNDLPYIFVQVYRLLEGSALGILLFSRFLIASLVMIVPTFLLGALFPLVVRITTREAHERTTGETVGNAYAANTVGAIAGSFASGFVLIPWLGLLDSLKLCSALNFVAAAALFLVTSNTVREPVKRLHRAAASRLRLIPRMGIVLSLALIVVVVAVDLPWDSDVMSSAVYRYAPSMSSLSRQELFDFLKRGQGETIFYKEGITATVAVQQNEGERVLKVNGKPEASTTGDMPTQILIGAIPLLMRESTDDVLLIGLGSGVTLGSIQQFPVKRMTCVELEPAVVEASHHFNDVNNRPLEDSRLRLVSNDGRNFIFTTEEKFDVIVSEPSNPWVSGVANLFTLEYFKRGAERLKEGGLFSQWLQIYEMSPEDVRTLIATFRKAFPFVYVFRGSEGDLMLTGSKTSRLLDLRVVRAHLANARVAADFKRIGVSSEADLLSRFYMGPDETGRFGSGSVINTDDNALIEFNAPRRVGTAEETIARNVSELLHYAASPLPYLSGGSPHPSSNAELLLEVALAAINRDDKRRAEQFIGYSVEIADSARAHSVMGELHFSRGNETSALDEWHLALAMDPSHFHTLVNLGKFHLTKQDLAEAAGYLDRAIATDGSSARAHHLRGLAYQASGENALAAAEYRKALPDGNYTRGIKTYYLNFGTVLLSLGYYEEASQMLEEYTRLAPADHEAHYQLGVAYEIMSERSLDEVTTLKAVEELKRAIAIQPKHAMAHYYLSKAYRRLEMFDEAEVEFELYERLSP
jgi:spermidine synthase